MKDTIITAGPAEITLQLSKGFKDFCEATGVNPQAALQQFVNYLSVYGFYVADRNDPETAAALIFDFLVKSKGDLPDEPSKEKRSISASYLLRLNDVAFFEDDAANRAQACRELIQEWYLEFQKLKL